MAKAKDIVEDIVNPQAETLTMVNDRLKLYESYIADIEESRKEWWRIYRAQQKDEETTAEYKEQAAVPYTTATIHTIVPRLTKDEVEFRYKGETEKDNKNAKPMSELANDQARKDDLDLTAEDIVTETMITGTSFAKIPWTKDTLVADYDKPLFTIGGKSIGKIRKTIKKTLKDQPTVDHIPNPDFMFDPYGHTINGKNECDWVAHRKLVSEKYVIDKFGKECLDKLSQDEANLDDKVAKTQREVTLPKDKHKKVHELIEYWENDRKIVLIDRSYIAEDIPNPFIDKKKPFVYFVDHRIPGQLLGMGEIEFLIGLQDILNRMVLQMVDKQTQSEHNLLFLEEGSGLKKENFNDQPFGIHTVKDLTKLQFHKLDPVDPMTVNIIEMLKTFMEYVSGVSDYVKGTGDTSMNDTATGIQLIQEAANYVFTKKADLLIKMFYKKIGEFFVYRNQQFLTKSVTVSVKAEDGTEVYHDITRKDIEGNFICLIDKKPPMDDMIRRNDALQLYRQFRDDPDVDQFELKKDVLEAFGKDTKKLMPGKDETTIQTEAEVTDAEQEAASEDKLMFAGKTVTVADTDDHEVHIVVHEEALTQAPNEVAPIIDRHIQTHRAFLSPRLRPMMQPSILQNNAMPEEDLMRMEGGMANEEQAAGGFPEGSGGAEGTEAPAGASGQN